MRGSILRKFTVSIPTRWLKGDLAVTYLCMCRRDILVARTSEGSQQSTISTMGCCTTFWSHLFLGINRFMTPKLLSVVDRVVKRIQATFKQAAANFKS